MSPPLLQVEDLQVDLPGPRGPLPVVRGVSLTVGEGEVATLSGESGSGKSTILLALLGLLPPGSHVRGRALCAGHRLLPATEAELRPLRGRVGGAVFQEAALDPTMRIGPQVAEGAVLHLGLGRAEALRRAAELLRRVGLPDPGLLRRYPHQLSGGMRQRAALAGALAAEPRLLLADEPTSGLDPIMARAFCDLLSDLCAQQGLGLLLVSHDLGVAAALAGSVHVLYAGRIVERGRAADVLARPAHPYTLGLLGARPRLDGEALPAPIPGSPPSPADLPVGCAFAPRCPAALPACGREPAEAALAEPGHSASCWLHADPGGRGTHGR